MFDISNTSWLPLAMVVYGFQAMERHEIQQAQSLQQRSRSFALLEAKLTGKVSTWNEWKPNSVTSLTFQVAFMASHVVMSVQNPCLTRHPESG
ncbi:unnamed protein product [Protopolystoma xenopodis]|uniref:Uncharacterized protein n=1 Tax=Protopolystoma xenopodis TaxID=117903 RepID=A0A448X896_9PLAT|nr:unnamed protein product [Protopolystoma xenopodis]